MYACVLISPSASKRDVDKGQCVRARIVEGRGKIVEAVENEIRIVACVANGTVLEHVRLGVRRWFLWNAPHTHTDTHTYIR